MLKYFLPQPVPAPAGGEMWSSAHPTSLSGLYWAGGAPATAGTSELRAVSVSQSVRSLHLPPPPVSVRGLTLLQSSVAPPQIRTRPQQGMGSNRNRRFNYLFNFQHHLSAPLGRLVFCNSSHCIPPSRPRSLLYN